MTARHRRLVGILIYCAGVALLSGSAGLVLYGPAHARAFVFPASWIGILLVLDGLNAALSGESLLLSEPERFLGLYALSVPWWLFFELLNLRLRDWAYEGLPGSALARWAAYAVAFGAILPVLVELKRLLEFTLPLKRVPVRPFRLTEGLRDTMRLAGLACLALPLLWPARFFPLVWAFAFLLLEPSVSRDLPLESVLFDLSMGSAEALLSWVGAGALCAGLWAAANAWSAARWVPLATPATWSAFPVFALGCAALTALAYRLWPRLSVGARASAIFTMSAFSAAVFIGIDAFTLR